MVDAAREMVVPAGELPDPKLKVGVENVPTQGADAWSLTRDFMTMSKIGLMQEFPREDKRRLKVERAERDAERGAVGVEASTLAVERDAADGLGRAAFCGALPSARSPRRSARPSSTRRPSPRPIAPARRRRASSSRRRAWWSSCRNRATDAATQSKRARIVLARYVGAAAERPLGDAPDFTRLAGAARLADVDAQPELRLATAQESMAAAEAALAGAAKKPDWSAEVSYALPRIAVFEHGLADVHDRPAVVARARGRIASTRRSCSELDAARAMREDTQRMRAAEVRVDARRMGIGARAGAARSRPSCFRSPCNAARRRWPPIAAAPVRSSAVLDARRARARRRARAHHPAAGRRQGVGLAQFRRSGTEGS